MGLMERLFGMPVDKSSPMLEQTEQQRAKNNAVEELQAQEVRKLTNEAMEGQNVANPAVDMEQIRAQAAVNIKEVADEINNEGVVKITPMSAETEIAPENITAAEAIDANQGPVGHAETDEPSAA